MTSRRTFARTLAAAAAASPLAAQQPAQQPAQPLPIDDFDLDLKMIDIPMSEDRQRQVKASLAAIAKEIHTLRAFELRRDSEPATSLGVFDSTR
jgi:hypothetical protein